MRASLDLQLSLYRKQKALIARSVVGASREFRRYERRYRNATRGYRRHLGRRDVDRAVAASDVVFVGDYHTLHLAQEGFLRLAQAAHRTGRRVVLALEFVEGRHQAALDDWLAGSREDDDFLRDIGHPYRGPFDIWPNFAPLLHWARDERLEVVAIDLRAQGPDALPRRDAYAARRVARAAAAEDRPLVLVLVGQFHVTPAHLPAQVAARLPDRELLVVYQNAEAIYWRLAREGAVDRAFAVEVRPRELCLVTASPVVCQQSFLDYLESEADDAPLGQGGAGGAFRQVARRLASLIDLDVEDHLEDVEVATAQELDVLARLAERARFSRQELAALERHVLSRESAYVPRARLVWLARASLNHVAEEAAHFVRHAAVGDLLEAPRGPTEAFWSRCLEEALGFFGSRLVNPARRSTSPQEWSEAFERGDGHRKATAAFVLALRAAQPDGPEACRPLIPAGDEDLFHAVSHALGYQLGEAMHAAFERGRLEPFEVRSLFHDPFRHAEGRYFALAQRFGTAG